MADIIADRWARRASRPAGEERVLRGVVEEAVGRVHPGEAGERLAPVPPRRLVDQPADAGAHRVLVVARRDVPELDAGPGHAEHHRVGNGPRRAAEVASGAPGSITYAGLTPIAASTA